MKTRQLRSREDAIGSRRYRALQLLIAGLCTALTSGAGASDAVESARIEYRAPAVCPDFAAFTVAVQTRSRAFDLVEIAPSERSFQVEILEEADIVIGRVRVLDQPEPRTFRAARCSDVAEMLAFVIAMKLDGKAWLSDTQEEMPASASAVSQAPVPASLPHPPVLTSLNADPRRERRDALPPSSREPEAHVVPVWETGATAFGIHGTAPDWMFGGAVFVGLGLSGFRAPFQPALRLSASRAQSGDIDVGDFALRSALSRVHLDLCGITLGRSDALELRACARTEVGILEAEGIGSTQLRARSVNNLWTAVGATLRLRIPIFESLGAELETGALAPLDRRVYVFVTPKEVAHETAWLTPWFALNGGVRLP